MEEIEMFRCLWSLFGEGKSKSSEGLLQHLFLCPSSDLPLDPTTTTDLDTPLVGIGTETRRFVTLH